MSRIGRSAAPQVETTNGIAMYPVADLSSKTVLSLFHCTEFNFASTALRLGVGRRTQTSSPRLNNNMGFYSLGRLRVVRVTLILLIHPSTQHITGCLETTGIRDLSGIGT